MKNVLIIVLIAGLMMACANPVGEEVEEPIIVTNPFIGTWKNIVSESFGANVGFTFREDGTYDYWQSNINLRGSGNYTYTDTYLFFRNFSYTSNITVTIPDLNQKYEWFSEDKFFLHHNETINYADGSYVKQ